MTSGYLASDGGRLTLGTLSFAVTTAGALAALGPGPHVIYFVAAVPLVCIVGCILAVGFSIERFGRKALALMLALPFLTGPYLAALYALPKAGAAVGGLLLATGALLFWAAVGGRPS